MNKMDNRSIAKPVSALILHIDDNVATAVRQLTKGDSIALDLEEDAIDIVLSQDIPFGHKFAAKDIQKGEPVIKYGEIIGKAVTKISKGGHVHVHNVEGLKGRGDKL